MEAEGVTMSRKQRYTGITRARLEQLAQERGFTVQESHLDIYFRSLNRSFDTTFLTIVDGEKHIVQFNQDLLADWIPESYVVDELEKYVKVSKP